ncbi:MAG: hypothetical protein JNG86_07775, partial [Verrucomicrobiaceae bacterium]|nr:hypothetical protein [Verrucomicrobiaceae bacterium]
MNQPSSMTPALLDASEWITPLLLFSLLAVTAMVRDGKDASEGAAWVARMFLGFAVVMAGGVMLVGPMLIELTASGSASLALRVDALSSIMLLVMSILGVVVTRHTAYRLDDHPMQARLSRRLVATLTGFVLLVMSSHWLMFIELAIITGLSLHLLL